jgi:hypothetical protein
MKISGTACRLVPEKNTRELLIEDEVVENI